MDPRSLIDRYLLGEITESELAELDQELQQNPDLRREFVTSAATDTGLREIAFERSVSPTLPSSENANSKQPVRIALLGLAVAALLLVAFRPSLFQPAPIATLASSENAAWESSLPTTPGSRLPPGSLILKSGVATIRFHSGAEVVLEAPAQLELLTPMKGKLVSGAAVIDVPEPAIGFVMETPDGYAVDYGTQFAVRVDQVERQSDFEIIEGEIAVHHPGSGEEVRLTDQGKTVTISDETLVVTDMEERHTGVEPSENVIRIGTNGRSTSVLRNNKRKKFLNPEVLSVKRTNSGKWNYYSFFAFDLSTVDLTRIQSARLRLNLVPSTRGLVSALPKINRFGIYGLTNQAKADWKIDCLWEDAPTPDDGVLLGTFEIRRSEQRGSFGIQSETLLKFLRQHANDSVTLILVRETTQINGIGPSMTHMFASDSHPEAVGPMLEFSLKKPTH